MSLVPLLLLNLLLDLSLIFQHGAEQVFLARLTPLDAGRWFELVGYSINKERRTYRSWFMFITFGFTLFSVRSRVTKQTVRMWKARLE